MGKNGFALIPLALGVAGVLAIFLVAAWVVSSATGGKKPSLKLPNFEPLLSSLQEPTESGPEPSSDPEAPSDAAAQLETIREPVVSASHQPRTQTSIAYTPDGGQASLVILEPSKVVYVEELGTYVARVAIINRSPANIVDFRLTLQVGDLRVKLAPFSGSPESPEPGPKFISPGHVLDCPVIGKGRAPKRGDPKVVSGEFFLDANPGRVEAESGTD